MEVKDKVEISSEGLLKEESKNNGAGQKPKADKKKLTSSKINSLKKKLEKVETGRDEFKDQLLRKAAEFDNYKKRTENEISKLISRANAGLITELLPVLDDFERFLNTGHEGDDIKTMSDGIEIIYRSLVKLLEKQGVERIEAVGQEFDPEKHEALMQVENDEHPSNTVVEEHLKGYVMNDRVLRHSQVLVSK